MPFWRTTLRVERGVINQAPFYQKEIYIALHQSEYLNLEFCERQQKSPLSNVLRLHSGSILYNLDFSAQTNALRCNGYYFVKKRFQCRLSSDDIELHCGLLAKFWHHFYARNGKPQWGWEAKGWEDLPLEGTMIRLSSHQYLLLLH